MAQLSAGTPYWLVCALLATIDSMMLPANAGSRVLVAQKAEKIS